MSVTEAEIREARRMMEDLEGVSLCFSSSTAVAGLIKHARNGGVPRQETVLINLTGADRRGAAPPVNVNMLRRGPAGWQPDEDPDPRTVAL